jgi:hypothetical protein
VPDAHANRRAARPLQHANRQLGITPTSYRTDDGDPLHLDLAIDDLLRIVRRPRNWLREADEIVQALAETIRGRTDGRSTIEDARWYGTVCNPPEHVVVQIALSGTTNHQPATNHPWLHQLTHEIRAAFQQRGWPPTCTINVEFHSER